MSGALMGNVWEIELSPPEQTVMLALADHGSDVPGRWGFGYNIFPSVELLAWKTGKTPRQIQRILRVLENKRVIIPVAFAGGGRGHATRYEMHLENGALKSPPRDLKGDIQGIDHEPVKGDIQGIDPENDLKGDIQGLKGDIQGLKGDIQGLKGDIAMSPEPSYNHHMNRQEPDAHAREKKKRAEAEADPEPTPGSAAPPLPPPFNVFAADYRRAHGIGSRYSDITRAYWDTFMITPHEAEMLRRGERIG